MNFDYEIMLIYILHIKTNRKITSTLSIVIQKTTNRSIRTRPGNAHAQEESLSLSRSKQAH